MNESLKAVVEALIFASPEPLTVRQICRLLDNAAREEVEAAIAALRQEYEAPRGLQLIEVAGGYRIVTRPELHEWVRRLFHERSTLRLSVPALETLAVIAYRQPITAPEIAEIRGVNAAGVLATLLERRLIRIVGRKPVVGRPFMYATTREFLDRFGLKDLSDLPRIEDMAEALGFELPAGLTEPTPGLPFDSEPAGDPAGNGGAAREAAGADRPEAAGRLGTDRPDALGETPAHPGNTGNTEPDPLPASSSRVNDRGTVH